MPTDYRHPSSDVALNLMHSVVQQCLFNRAFPAELKILDRDMKVIDQVRLVSAEDESIKAAMRLIRRTSQAHAVRIEPGPQSTVAVRCWIKIVSSYQTPDDRASATRSVWERNYGIDPDGLTA